MKNKSHNFLAKSEMYNNNLDYIILKLERNISIYSHYSTCFEEAFYKTHFSKIFNIHFISNINRCLSGWNYNKIKKVKKKFQIKKTSFLFLSSKLVILIFFLIFRFNHNIRIIMRVLCYDDFVNVNIFSPFI